MFFSMFPFTQGKQRTTVDTTPLPHTSQDQQPSTSQDSEHSSANSQPKEIPCTSLVQVQDHTKTPSTEGQSTTTPQQTPDLPNNPQHVGALSKTPQPEENHTESLQPSTSHPKGNSKGTSSRNVSYVVALIHLSFHLACSLE